VETEVKIRSGIKEFLQWVEDRLLKAGLFQKLQKNIGA
jgi:hypothetical protein